MGADTLTGGAGADIFVYGNSNDSPLQTSVGAITVTADDLIASFQAGVDKIDLSAFGFTGLSGAVATLAQTLPALDLPGLHLHPVEGFLALTPTGDTTALLDLAAQVVEHLDALRAPLTAAEIARRRPDRLTPRQRALLDLYGYPYVMEEFRFHLTLSSNLSKADQMSLLPLAQAHFAPYLPQPFRIRDLCLFGEGWDGSFHLLHRYPLT